jgi:GMP synthase-like glutamine amidotransferase
MKTGAGGHGPGAGEKRVLAFRHVPFEGAGRIASVLAQRNIQLDYADLYVPGATAPDVDAYSALIFLGGPMSANDDLPYLRQEMEWIAQATASDRPVLGICLGAQLLARSLGARVYRNPVKEIGWFDLQFTPAAAGDTLFAGLETSRFSSGTGKRSTCRQAPSGWPHQPAAGIRHFALEPGNTGCSSIWR